MMGTHHHPPVAVHIAKGDLWQDLIARITLEKVKRVIDSLIILEFILIKIMLMMNKNCGIEKHVVFANQITM